MVRVRKIMLWTAMTLVMVAIAYQGGNVLGARLAEQELAASQMEAA